MAGNDNFCLRLNSFDKSVQTAWQEMQMEEDFCDITLACQDKQIKTHKLIISSYSPVLRDILKSTQSPHPFIYLRRVKYKDLQNLLTFMYQGEVNVPEENLTGFLEVAEDLNIRGLSKGNMEVFNSNEEDLPKLTPSKFEASPERNRNQEENKSEISFNHLMKDYQQESFVNIRNNLIAPTEKQRIRKQKQYNEGSNQNIGSRITEKSFHCGKCDKQFSSYPGLNFHDKSVHEGFHYECDKCKYKATTKPNLYKHVKSIHEGKRYPCDQCDYKATQTSSLRTHQMNSHN